MQDFVTIAADQLGPEYIPGIVPGQRIEVPDHYVVDIDALTGENGWMTEALLLGPDNNVVEAQSMEIEMQRYDTNRHAWRSIDQGRSECTHCTHLQQVRRRGWRITQNLCCITLTLSTALSVASWVYLIFHST